MSYEKILKNIIYPILLMIGLLVAASIIGILFREIGIPETNIVIVYILAVLLTARYIDSNIFGIIASIIATLAYNYFFTAPYFTLSVEDPNYIITLGIMMITALITSALTSQVKQNASRALEKEEETRALYRLTNHLSEAMSMDSIVSAALEVISQVMLTQAACLCFDELGNAEKEFVQQMSDGTQMKRKSENIEKIQNNFYRSRSTYEIGEEFCDWPIHGQETILGILRIPKEYALILSESQTRLLQAMIESTAIAMDRLNLSQERIRSHEEVEQERYRSNLLRAISHDLRTPLSGIIGTSEMLMDMSKKEDPRYSLAHDIYKEADWLHALVENILSLTRLQNGKLTLHKEKEVMEEIIGSAVHRVSQASQEYEIGVHTPVELIVVPMDAKLIEQVIINLLDNAIKHTPKDGEISVTLLKDEKNNTVEISVRDSGEGISDKDFPKIFEMFYTTYGKHADAQHGIGLGLTICNAIIKAHGGKIEAHNNVKGKGVSFIFTLPLGKE